MANHIGDHQGEHLHMERGEQSAWPHVIIGAGMLFSVSVFIIVGFFDAIVSRLFTTNLGLCTSVGAVALGMGIVWWIYLDRWRVNEAYTSRQVTGPATLMYLPMISIGYALSRLVERLKNAFAKQPPPEP